MRLIDADALLEALEQALNGNRYISLIDLITNAPTVQQSEPFGYFKAEPFGWTDCAETDEGAIALYEAPTVQREGWVSVPIEPTEEMLDAVLKGTPYVDDNKQLMREAYKAMIQDAPTDSE